MKNKFLTGLMRWGSVEGKMSYFQPYAGFLKELSRVMIATFIVGAKRLRKGTVWAGKSHFMPAMLPSASSLLLTWLLAVTLLWAGCNWFGNDDGLDIEPVNWQTEETLPEMTTTGENTFGCLVDGEVWRPKGGPYFGLDAQLSFSYHEPTGGLFISASRRLGPNDNGYDTYQRIGINATFKGISPSDSVRQCLFADINRCSSWNGDPMILDSLYTNVIDVIFLDTDQNIISGTFDFVFVKEDCQDTIYVTDGRFDIKYAN